MSEEKKEEKKDEKKIEQTQKNFLVEKYHEFRGEFRKIVWPDRPALIKSTVTVISISLIFGVIITVMDGAFSIVFTSLVDFFRAS